MGQPNGGNLGGFTMKQPKLSDLKLDKRGTRRIRSEISKLKKIKITINIDESSIKELREISGKTGVPYQTLLNQVLQDGLQKRRKRESRLDRLEEEIKKLKEKLVA